MEAVYHQNCDSSNEKAADFGAPRAITQYPKGNSNCSVSSQGNKGRFPISAPLSGRDPRCGPPAGGRTSTTPSYGARSMKSSKNASSRFQVPGFKCRWILSVPRPVRLGGFPAPDSRLCPPARVSPCFLFPVPDSRCCFFATSYPQRRVPKSACQKPSNSSQNRSKRRRFPSKRHQKGAHFVMPILTFCGVTPSGASARAVLACRKAVSGCFWTQVRACAKVIHKMCKTGNRDSGFGIRQRTTTGNRDSGVWAPLGGTATLCLCVAVRSGSGHHGHATYVFSASERNVARHVARPACPAVG